MKPMDLGLKPRPKGNPEDSLIPLINVVFLLLIFFMIAGQISDDHDTGLQPPISSSEEKLKADWVIQLDLAGQATVQGEALALEQVAQWVATNGVTNSAKTLAIKADGQIQAKQLGQWVAALRQAKVAKITLYSQKPTSNTP